MDGFKMNSEVIRDLSRVKEQFTSRTERPQSSDKKFSPSNFTAYIVLHVPHFHGMNKEDRYRRTGNLTLADRGCSHTELWFSGKILPVASQAQGHVARKDEESVSSHQASFTLGYSAMTVSQQHTWSPGPLHSQQTPNVCIQQGCTAAPHSLSTKW